MKQAPQGRKRRNKENLKKRQAMVEKTMQFLKNLELSLKQG